MSYKNNDSRHNSAIVFVIAFCVGCVLIGLSFLPTLHYLENRIYDTVLRARPSQPVAEDVVIIFIGDDTIQALGNWPVTRDYYASLIHILNENGARQIVFDLLFAERQPRRSDYDDALVAQTDVADNVYLPYYLLMEADAAPAISDRVAISPRMVPNAPLLESSTLHFPLAFDGIFPFDELKSACRGMGHSNVHVDMDGIIRQYPLFITYNEVLFPSLGLVVAADYLGLDQSTVRVIDGRYVELGPEHRIPVDDMGHMQINFSGPLEQFENYSMLQVLQSYKQQMQGEKPFIPLDTFRDKIVLIGMTATGATDLHPTPISALYPLVGTQATIISNILMHNYLRWGSFAMTVIELFGLMILMAVALNWLRVSVTFLLTFILGGLVCAAHYMLLSQYGIYYPLLPPVGAVVLVFVLGTVYLFRVERKSRERLDQQLTLIGDDMAKKDQQIQRVEAALATKADELNTLLKKAQDDAESMVTEEIRTLQKERDALAQEYHSLQADKTTLAERIDVLKGEAQAYIFDSRGESPLRQELSGQFDQILGDSELLLRELQKVDRAAPFDSNILITGESGTGKELIAEAIHQNSKRADGPLVVVNCAAVPADLIESELFGHEKGSFTSASSRRIGKFELANKGTLFLDEIGDMPLEMQAKILRAIQQREFRRVGGTEKIKVDVRLVCATNKNLADEVKNKHFREDLYHRINVIPIRLPALRERKEDIPQLVTHFLVQKSSSGRTYTVTRGVMTAFLAYHWPGNIRELQQVVERMTVLADSERLTVSDLPRDVLEMASESDDQVWEWDTELPLKDVLEDYERSYIYKKLSQNEWNISRTAKKLQIGRRSLHKKLNKYGIVREKTDDVNGD